VVKRLSSSRTEHVVRRQAQLLLPPCSSVPPVVKNTPENELHF
jgi:hypothetical protein